MGILKKYHAWIWINDVFHTVWNGLLEIHWRIIRFCGVAELFVDFMHSRIDIPINQWSTVLIVLFIQTNPRNKKNYPHNLIDSSVVKTAKS